MIPLLPHRLLALAQTNKGLDEEDLATFCDHAENHQDAVATSAAFAIKYEHHEFLSSVVEACEFWCRDVFLQLSPAQIQFLLDHYPNQASTSDVKMYQINSLLASPEPLATKLLQMVHDNQHLFPKTDRDWTSMLNGYSNLGNHVALQWLIQNRPIVLSNPKVIDRCCASAVLNRHADALAVLIPHSSSPRGVVERLASELPPGAVPAQERKEYFDMVQPYVDHAELTQSLGDRDNASSRPSKM